MVHRLAHPHSRIRSIHLGHTNRALGSGEGRLLALSVAMSILLLVPINNRSKDWTAEDHPEDWREQHRRWDRLHYVQVIVILAAFVLLALAVTVL